MTGPRSELLEALIRASSDAVVVVGDSGRIEMASPSVVQLFGWDPDELVGQQVEVLIPEELHALHTGHRADYAARPSPRPMGVGLDLRARRRDGTTFPVDVSLAPVVVHGSHLVGAFVRDVTDQRRAEELQRYLNEIDRQLLSGRGTREILALTARRARQLVAAAASWVVAPGGEHNHLFVVAADGEGAGSLEGLSLSVTSLSATAMSEARARPVEDMAADPAVLTEARGLGLGPGLYLPMLAEDGPIGCLVVARVASEAPFDEEETQALQAFTSAASMVLALGTAREELDKLRIVSEHERIARDLHDTVIQRLFALGMSLQSVENLASGTVGSRIHSAVDAIDQVIREIRETIFQLSRPGIGGPDIRRQLRDVAAEATDQLGFLPRVAVRGPVEAAVSEQLLPDLLAVAREALSNAARHAKAQKVEVVLEAKNGSVTLSVLDDGLGFPDGPSAGHGLANMAARADMLGGHLTVSPRLPSGSIVEWQVPTS